MAQIKPVANYSGEFSVIQAGDVIATTAGGTGLSSFVAGNYLRALDSATLETITPLAVRTDLAAISFTFNETAPASPLVGDEWVKPSTGKKYKWISDGNSSQWVELESTISVGGSGLEVPTYIQDTQPVLDGKFLWIQTGVGDDGNDVMFWFHDDT
jgi:hypothetical protein